MVYRRCMCLRCSSMWRDLLEELPLLAPKATQHRIEPCLKKEEENSSRLQANSLRGKTAMCHAYCNIQHAAQPWSAGADNARRYKASHCRVMKLPGRWHLCVWMPAGWPPTACLPPEALTQFSHYPSELCGRVHPVCADHRVAWSLCRRRPPAELCGLGSQFNMPA